eukprot:TRINITY_DN2982_c6_g1_i1.p1 TRINITY_DN2982_c6_g1~~TRINITY_DN2982_c6_g1_i1.p1  ORF type:complete len:249 (-),score=114.29 TRINITY_DN2982_c6_g1_i1:31-777(-)
MSRIEEKNYYEIENQKNDELQNKQGRLLKKIQNLIATQQNEQIQYGSKIKFPNNLPNSCIEAFENKISIDPFNYSTIDLNNLTILEDPFKREEFLIEEIKKLEKIFKTREERLQVLNKELEKRINFRNIEEFNSNNNYNNQDLDKQQFNYFNSNYSNGLINNFDSLNSHDDQSTNSDNSILLNNGLINLPMKREKIKKLDFTICNRTGIILNYINPLYNFPIEFLPKNLKPRRFSQNKIANTPRIKKK